jgi:hypothetical protein
MMTTGTFCGLALLCLPGNWRKLVCFVFAAQTSHYLTASVIHAPESSHIKAMSHFSLELSAREQKEEMPISGVWKEPVSFTASPSPCLGNIMHNSAVGYTSQPVWRRVDEQRFSYFIVTFLSSRVGKAVPVPASRSSLQRLSSSPSSFSITCLHFLSVYFFHFLLYAIILHLYIRHEVSKVFQDLYHRVYLAKHLFLPLLLFICPLSPHMVLAHCPILIVV